MFPTWVYKLDDPKAAGVIVQTNAELESLGDGWGVLGEPIEEASAPLEEKRKPGRRRKDSK